MFEISNTGVPAKVLDYYQKRALIAATVEGDPEFPLAMIPTDDSERDALATAVDILKPEVEAYISNNHEQVVDAALAGRETVARKLAALGELGMKGSGLVKEQTELLNLQSATWEGLLGDLLPSEEVAKEPELSPRDRLILLAQARGSGTVLDLQKVQLWKVLYPGVDYKPAKASKMLENLIKEMAVDAQSRGVPGVDIRPNGKGGGYSGYEIRHSATEEVVPHPIDRLLPLDLAASAAHLLKLIPRFPEGISRPDRWIIDALTAESVCPEGAVDGIIIALRKLGELKHNRQLLLLISPTDPRHGLLNYLDNLCVWANQDDDFNKVFDLAATMHSRWVAERTTERLSTIAPGLVDSAGTILDNAKKREQVQKQLDQLLTVGQLSNVFHRYNFEFIAGKEGLDVTREITLREALALIAASQYPDKIWMSNFDDKRAALRALGSCIDVLLSRRKPSPDR